MKIIIVSTLIILNIFNFNNSFAQKPKRIYQTETNKDNECVMPILAIQDASDISTKLLKVKTLSESKSLLLELHKHLSYFEKFKTKCYCLQEYEDEIFIFSPADKIVKALLIEDLDEMKKVCKKIDSDIELIWLLAVVCF
jgi:hypothetical protein